MTTGTKKEEQAHVEEVKAPTPENRIDEDSIYAFKVLGYMDADGQLPDDLIAVFKEFKMKKDIIRPGRLSAEGYATIAVLFEITTSMKSK